MSLKRESQDNVSIIPSHKAAEKYKYAQKWGPWILSASSVFTPSFSLSACKPPFYLPCLARLRVGGLWVKWTRARENSRHPLLLFLPFFSFAAAATAELVLLLCWSVLCLFRFLRLLLSRFCYFSCFRRLSFLILLRPPSSFICSPLVCVRGLRQNCFFD